MNSEKYGENYGLGRGAFGCYVILPLLICGVLLGIWFLNTGSFGLTSPERAVEKAHQKWDSNDTKLQIEAIKEYQSLLKRTDAMDPSRRWVKDDRDTLYRRIVVHEYRFQKNPTKAREYMLDAWDEGIRDLRIQEADVREYWEEVTAPLKIKDQIKDRNQ